MQYIPRNIHIVPILCCFDGFVVPINFTPVIEDSFSSTGTSLWLPQCRWCSPDKNGKICHWFTRHSWYKHKYRTTHNKPCAYSMGYIVLDFYHIDRFVTHSTHHYALNFQYISRIINTVHIVLCFLVFKNRSLLPISCRFTSLALGQSGDGPRFSALLALCAGNSPVTGEFSSQRLLTRDAVVLIMTAL